MSLPNKDIHLSTSFSGITGITCIENALCGPFAYVGIGLKSSQPSTPVLGVNLDSGAIKGTLL
jgi:hypothetical protein